MYPSLISPNSNILCNNSKILNQEKDINTILLTRLQTLFTFHHQFLHALIVCVYRFMHFYSLHTFRVMTSRNKITDQSHHHEGMPSGYPFIINCTPSCSQSLIPGNHYPILHLYTCVEIFFLSSMSQCK